MDFRIADTFTDSLAKLTGDEQKAAKTTAFELQMNPAHPSMSFERVDRAKDKNFWSARVSRDLRLIVHKSGGSLILCYVAHHDPAYQWAERRKVEVHPTTGAAQLIELRETVKEIAIPKYVEVEQPVLAKPALFAHISDEVLLGYGVPTDWLKDVRQANEDSILDLADHLPGEAAEALLNLATGKTPPVPQPAAVGADPFEHPDAQRRFRVMSNVEELERALEYPWEKWSVFLHPAQRELVKGDYSGPVRVSGSAGTGKTIVALHRAVHLARTHPDARILLTTFSHTLANALQVKLRRLISNEPRLGSESSNKVSIDQKRDPISSGLGNLRELIANAAYLSQWRGTKRGLLLFLQIATGTSNFEIEEQTTGANAPPRSFHIRVRAPRETELHRALIERIIQLEKPAYVTYELDFPSPGH